VRNRSFFQRVRPRINAKVRDRYFGFLIKETRRKPELFYSDAFVRESSFERKYYTDMYGHFHFIEERFWYKDENYIYPLRIKTYDKGDYTFFLYFAFSCNEYKSVKEERHTLKKKTLKIKIKQKNA
jgi:hypothetical protein